MTASILMKLEALHKSMQKQIAPMLSFCLLFVSEDRADAQEIGLPTGYAMTALGPSPSYGHPDSNFIQSLLKLDLYEIAIETCRDRAIVAEGTQSEAMVQPEAMVQWSILQMQSIAAKVAADPSIVDSPANADTLLEANQAIVDRCLNSPRLPWLKQEQLWCRWFVLRRLQTSYIAVPARKSIRDWSLTSIRTCLEDLAKLQSQIQKASFDKSNAKISATPEQWSSLINDTLLLQTDLLLLRAQYYPAKSTDRIAAATELLSAIEKAEQRIRPDWSGRPNVELARYTAYLHLDRTAEALYGLKTLSQQLNAPTDGKPKQANRWRLPIACLAAESSRILGNLSESQKWIDEAGGWTAAPEVAIEHFSNLLATLPGKSVSESQLAEAIRIKKEIGRRFGSYWQQRADAVLLSNSLFESIKPIDPIKSASTSPSTASSSMLKVELLLSEAKQLLSAKRIQEAIEKFGQAELSAANAGNEPQALEIAIQSAAILFKNDQKDDAESEFHRAALAYRLQLKAPDAAIMSVWAFDKVAKFDANASQSPQEEQAELKQQIYRGRLMDIVSTWPSTPQAIQATAKLDRLLLSTDQFPELIAFWSKRLDDDLIGEKQTWTVWDQAFCRFALARTATSDTWYDHSIYSTEYTTKLNANLEDLRGKLLERSSPTTRVTFEAILASTFNFDRWSKDAIADRQQSSSNEFSSVATSFLFQSTASSLLLEKENTNLTAAKADSISSLSLRWSVAESMFQRLVSLGRVKAVDATELATFRVAVDAMKQLETQPVQSGLAFIGALQRIQFGRSLQLFQAAIAYWSGDESTGAEIVKNAMSIDAKSPWWIYRSACVLQTIPNQQEQSIRQFRQLANGFPPGSTPWLESRARTAQTMLQMGKQKEAKDLSDLVFATFPAASQEWKIRFGQ